MGRPGVLEVGSWKLGVKCQRKLKAGIERRERRAEENASLNARQERQSQGDPEQRRQHPPHERAGAALAEEQLLRLELHAMEQAHVRFAQALYFAQHGMRDGPVAEMRVDHLRRDRGGGERHVHADGARGAHRVRRIADEQQTVARPVVDEPNRGSRAERTG